MNNIKNLTSAIQKKNKDLKKKINRNLPKISNYILLSGPPLFYSYLGTGPDR